MSRPPSTFVSKEAVAEAGGPHAIPLMTFRLLQVVGTKVRRLADARFRDEAMTIRQATLITIAKELGQPSMSEVAEAMSTSHQNVKQITMGLVRRGFARIVPDATDSRVRRILVTARSDRFWASRDRDDAAAIAGWFSDMAPKELAQVNRLLVKLAAALESAERAGDDVATNEKPAARSRSRRTRASRR